MKRIVLATLIVAALIACGRKDKKNTFTEALPINVTTPIIKDVILTKSYPGYLDADATVALMGRVNGTLESINYKPGSIVKKGELLFTIEPTLYKNAVIQAESVLKTAKANHEYAKSNYQRMKIAIESDAVSQIQLLQAETAMAQYEAQISNAEAALSSAKINLGYCYIRAPHRGEVNLSELSVGAYISGEVVPVKLATLYKVDKMYSYFDISDNQWIKRELNKGSVTNFEYVTIKMGNNNILKREAKMDYLSPNINLNTGTLRVRAELGNADGKLKPGAYVNVTLPYDEYKNGVLIRDASISTDQLGKFIYVVNDSNIVQYRPITVGEIVEDTLRFVTSGIKEGERYVTDALLKVRNGMKILPINIGD